MAEEETPFERGLRRLGERLRIGLAKRHPVSEERLKAVRALVRKQWEQEQKQREGGIKDQGPHKADKDQQKQTKSSQSKGQTKSAPKNKSHDKGWSHGY